jgi:hypothetical protein
MCVPKNNVGVNTVITTRAHLKLNSNSIEVGRERGERVDGALPLLLVDRRLCAPLSTTAAFGAPDEPGNLGLGFAVKL